MRIALLGTYPIAELSRELGIANPPGQSSSWNVNLAAALAAIPETEIHFITMHPKIPRDHSIWVGNLLVHCLSSVPRVRFATVLQYNRHRIVRRLREIGPDVVHGHGTEHEYPYVGSVSGFPWVITMHNYMPDVICAAGSGHLGKRWMFRYFERKVLREATHVICTTQFLAGRVAGETQARIHVIPNATSEVFSNQIKAETPDQPTVLFVGYFRPEKNLIGLIRAFAMVVERIPEARLRLVGAPTRDDSAYYEAVQQEIARLGSRDRVDVVGRLPQPAVATEMANASLLVLPSLQENFGLVLAEAMATGTPVVATRVGGVPFVVRDGETGLLVRPDDVDDLARKLIQLLQDHKARARMGALAREFATKRYCGDAIATDTMEVYRQVLADG